MPESMLKNQKAGVVLPYFTIRESEKKQVDNQRDIFL